MLGIVQALYRLGYSKGLKFHFFSFFWKVLVKVSKNLKLWPHFAQQRQLAKAGALADAGELLALIVVDCEVAVLDDVEHIACAAQERDRQSASWTDMQPEGLPPRTCMPGAESS